MNQVPEDIADLLDQFEAVEREATGLVSALSAEQGVWRAAPASWSVAECLDHMAVANRVYLASMREAIAHAPRQTGNRRPANPGIIGGMFVRMLEPPPRRLLPMPAPAKIRPRVSPPLNDAVNAFMSSMAEVRAFATAYSELDLTRVRFRNPLVRGVRFSVATGLHVIAAHTRRHLYQAHNVRSAMAAAGQSAAA